MLNCSMSTLKEETDEVSFDTKRNEQHMLAFGRALMTDAPMLLLVEQNANMSLHIASRGYVLETGRIVLSGTGKELTGNPRVKEAYLGG